MNFPKKVKVCGKVYTFEGHTHMEDCGNLIPTECKAYINTNMDKQQVRDTVLHELMHAIEFELCLDLEERHVHVIATATLDMLLSNKHLVKFLTGD